MTEDITQPIFSKIERFLASQAQLFKGLPKASVLAVTADEVERIQNRIAALEQETEVYFEYEVPENSPTLTEVSGKTSVESEDTLLTETIDSREDKEVHEEIALSKETQSESDFAENIQEAAHEIAEEIEDKVDLVDVEVEVEEVFEKLLIEENEEVSELALVSEIEVVDVVEENEVINEKFVEEIQAERLAEIIDEGEQSAFFTQEEPKSELKEMDSVEEVQEEKPYVDPLQFDLFGPAPTPPAKSKKSNPKPAVVTPSLFDDIEESSSNSSFDVVKSVSEESIVYEKQEVESDLNHSDSTIETESPSLIEKVEDKSEPEITTYDTNSELIDETTAEIQTVTVENSPFSTTDNLPVMPVPESVQLELNQCATLDDLRILCEKHKAILQTDLPNTNLVFGVGNPHATLMIVGEAPGENEDIKGEPFVGKAGQLLDKILEAIQLSRNEVYIANILKHRPPQNRDPFPEERDRSLPFLIRQIELIQPKLILCLGRISARTLLGLPEKVTLAELRGKFHPFLNGKVELTATYHPASLLRNPNWKKPTWEDVKMVRKRYDEVVL